MGKILVILVFLISSKTLAQSGGAVFSGMGVLFLSIQKLQNRNQLDVSVLAYLGTKEALEHNPDFYRERYEILHDAVVTSGKLDDLKKNVNLWNLHTREYKLSYTARADKTDDNILTSRSSSRVIREATMNTCVDYVKAFMGLRRLWKNSSKVDQWKVVYLFPKDLYNQKTCPTMGIAGNRRPFVHTALLAQVQGKWFVINPEVYPGQTQFDIVELGATLPTRHTIFSLPSLDNAWSKYVPFEWGGETETVYFEEGFDGKFLGNMVMSGKPESNICN